MDLFKIDISINELLFIRQSLDVVSITGKDAKFLAGLQINIENKILEIQKLIEDNKNKALQQAVLQDQEKQASKK